ncbi:hypothetical protein J7438_15275 [Thalassotalea sp. G20_0]|uniref:hypothetical protein n=1 Tax=Thalassotalea sp. G20_0 TaxID=2821093 RepID=UPI001AD95997|nr:hypothetical protein [Thalassotalea sp. G20_0]MBO9495439.1 hypothetical protein [Thalassotalea sp. G20_0]
MEPTINTFASGVPVYSNCFDDGASVVSNRKIVPVLRRHHLSPAGLSNGLISSR